MKKKYSKKELEKLEKEVGELFHISPSTINKYHKAFEVSPTTHKGKPALEITLGAMYEPPSYAGEGGVIGMLTRLRDICGGRDIDDAGSSISHGCETCDYGSFYSRSFVVW